jgi:Tfp pilus assembly protein PilF
MPLARPRSGSVSAISTYRWGERKRSPHFSIAETLAPGDPVAKAAVTSARHQQGQDVLAVDTSAEAQLMLTEALYKNHQPGEALREIDRVLKRDPSNEAAQQMKASLTQMNMTP